jgi:N-acetylglucosaminyldiphosphoundecaprenol N-acetyl-beta-D-mannosaminyltransferase
MVSAADLPAIELYGVRIHALRSAEVIEHVLAELAAGRGGWIVTPNLDHLRRLVHEPDFRALCAQADLAVADGMPLVWASRLQRTPLPERVAGSDLIHTLSAAAGVRRSARVFFLGGEPGAAEAAARILAERCPGLVVAGISVPPPGFERSSQNWDALARELTAARPDIVYVALGSPKQEQAIERLRACAPRAWWLGIGISFSFVSGEVRRAPRWVQRLGLEWLHRVAQEPRRLARRYFVQGLPFALALFAHSARRGLGASAAREARR